MALIKRFSTTPKIDFLSRRKIFLAISGLLMIASLGVFFVFVNCDDADRFFSITPSFRSSVLLYT